MAAARRIVRRLVLVRPVRFGALVVAATLAAAACAGDPGGDASGDDARQGDIEATVLATVNLGAGAEPTALVELADGRLAIGERLTGRIVAVNPSDAAEPVVLGSVDVSPNATGQRGLVGLAELDRVLYAAWTRSSDDRLVVGQVTPGPTRLIWEGPTASELANGGHLAAFANRIVVGVGDLEEPPSDDPSAPNRKLLSLDPAGGAGQRPQVLSDGWNNPFAFTVTADGEIWVADNAPGELPERIGRGDTADPRVDLPGRRAPAAVVDLGSGRVGVCGYLDGNLVEVQLRPSPIVGQVLVRGTCRTGATELHQDRLAVSDGQQVRILRVPRG